MQHWVKNNITFFLLLFLGTLSWSLTMIKSGWANSYGLGFWGANGHDGIWHIALINSLARGSFGMPVFSGEHLKNYHIGFDFFVALIHNITHIPVINLYFQVFPPLMAILIGYLTYKFVLLWKQSKGVALWSTFFVYFAGSYGWLVTLFRDGEISGESMFWSTQAISTLINPPFTFSIILILLGLISLIKMQSKRKVLYIIIAIVCFGILIEVKSYAGILALLGLGVVALKEVIATKKILNNYSLVFIISSTISFALFLQLNKLNSGLLIFKPFWFIETMMAISDRVGWPRFYEAMINWKAAGIYYKAIPAYLFAFLIFLIGNMGMRIVSIKEIINWVKNIKSLGVIELFTLTVIFFGFGLSLVFVQKGNPWNTIQFVYYALFLLSICTGIFTIEFINLFDKNKKIKLKYIFLFLLILFTIPTTISNLWYIYLPSRPPAKVSPMEIEALGFLNKQQQGVVLTYPFDEKRALAATGNPPRPLYLYDSTAYVSAISNKDVFLEDEVNLNIMDYQWSDRKQKVKNFYSSQNQKEIRNFLTENNISYIYWLKGQRATLGETQLCIFQLYENKEVNVYKVGKITGDNCVLN